MRKRRLLLAATALSAACSSSKKEQEIEPLPGNPKGSVYDAAALEPQPLPGNPKGSVYDAGVPIVNPDAPSANPDGPRGPRDAAITDASAPVDGNVPRDATVVDARTAPPDARPLPLPGNPKGSRYDDGLEPTKPKSNTPTNSK